MKHFNQLFTRILPEKNINISIMSYKTAGILSLILLIFHFIKNHPLK